jgi:hypothetical protein
MKAEKNENFSFTLSLTELVRKSGNNGEKAITFNDRRQGEW